MSKFKRIRPKNAAQLLVFTVLPTFVGVALLQLLHVITTALNALPLAVLSVSLYGVLLVVQYLDARRS
jgi:hypothetical protein